MRHHRPTDVRSARVAIVGLAPAGCKVLLCLLERGFRQLLLADSRPVGAPDFYPGSLLRPEDAGQPRGAALATRLRAGRPEIELSFVPGPEVGPAWPEPWLAACDLCLLCSEVAFAPLLLQVNAACLHRGVPLLPGLVVGRTGLVGPLIRAGKGPCLRCVDARITATAGWSLLASPQPPDPATVDRVSAALAAEAEQVVASGAGAGTAGTVVHFCAHGAATVHPVLRAARCPDCSSLGPFMPYRFARRFELAERSGPGPDHLLRLRGRLVSPLTGPIRSLDQVPLSAEDPNVAMWATTVTDTGHLSLGMATAFAGGCDLDGEAALAAALGEGIERLASAQPRRDDLFIAPFRALADQAVDPAAWDLFHPRTRALPGFPFPPPSRELPMSWLWGYSLTEQRPKAVPVAKVFAFRQALAPGDSTDFPIVSGFAAGVTPEEAIWHALLEVLERDAFMIAWANRLPMERLEIHPSSPHQVGAYLAAMAERGIEARCAAVELDLGTHFVVAIARSANPADPARWIATAADPDLANACRRAIKELVAGRVYVRGELRRVRGRLPRPVPEEVVEMGAHGLLYARPEMARHLDMWWNPSQSKPLPEPQPASAVWPRLQREVERIRQAGMEVLAVDLTPPELRELGLWVVKTLVPGTYPMNFDSRWPHFGGRRIREVPVACGLLPEPTGFEDFNRIPHPFP